MLKIKPILTEKSLEAAGSGKYSFWVSASLTKYKIKKLVEEIFGVHVKKVWTQNRTGKIRTTLARKKVTVRPKKKVLVVLEGKEKIDLFHRKGEK